MQKKHWVHFSGFLFSCSIYINLRIQLLIELFCLADITDAEVRTLSFVTCISIPWSCFILMYSRDLLYELMIYLNENYKSEVLEVSSVKGDIISEGNKSITVELQSKGNETEE